MVVKSSAISGREDNWDIPSDDKLHNWEGYYSALGRLVQMCGRAEARMHTTLKCMAFDLFKIERDPFEWEILDALIGTQSYNVLKDNMRRLMRVGNVSGLLIDEFNYLFFQLDNIHEFRNKLYHHGAHSYHEGLDQFYTSTDETSRESSQHEMIIFTVDLLLDMAYDLKQIDEVMYDISDILHPGHIDEEDLRRYLASHRPTWRYLPNKIRKTGPKHWPKPTRSRASDGTSATQGADEA